jgi:iron complex transport system substrate-binding protein
MNINDHIQLWDQAIVRVLDVRKSVLEPGKRLQGYTLPTSTFIYAVRGRGRLWLDGDVHYADRFYVLHGGKGACLEIEAETAFEYYLILYKAVLPQNSLYDFKLLMQNDNPFEKPFGFAPHDALELVDLIQRTHQNWSQTNRQDMLEIRGIFYQFVHRLFLQMQENEAENSQKSLAEQVLRFLSERYQEPKSIESLSLLLNYSPQHLSRKFKEHSGFSPIEYVIKLRIEKAQVLLLTTDATLQEIARNVGYSDLFYFNRIFKKYAGMAPGQFRNKHLTDHEQSSKHTKKVLKNSIVKHSSQNYIYIDNEKHYQYRGEEDYTMNKGSKTVMLSTIWLCFAIMLSACAAGTGTPASTGSGKTAGTETSTGNQPSNHSTEAVQASETKTVSTHFGDVKVPIDPKRVASIDYLGTVIALGVDPIGSNNVLLNSPYLKGHLEGVEDVGDSLEKLLAMEPDLIITHTTKPEVYEKYSEIAPTVSIASNTFNSVHEELTYFGEVLGKEAEATEWLNQYDLNTAKAKAKIAGHFPEGSTFSVFQEYDGQVFAFGPKSGRGGRNIYQVLGLPAPAAIPADVMAKTYSKISIESLPEYAGDYIVLTTESSLDELRKDPIWGSLNAVREGRIYLWNEERSWYRDPIALLAQTEELANWIVELSQQK